MTNQKQKAEEVCSGCGQIVPFAQLILAEPRTDKYGHIKSGSPSVVPGFGIKDGKKTEFDELGRIHLCKTCRHTKLPKNWKLVDYSKEKVNIRLGR